MGRRCDVECPDCSWIGARPVGELMLYPIAADPAGRVGRGGVGGRVARGGRKENEVVKSKAVEEYI